MSRNKEKAAPETLKDAIKELIRLAKAINTLEQVIDDNWGVQLIAVIFRDLSMDAGPIFM